MNFIMSVIFYNPLEMLFFILSSKILNNSKMNMNFKSIKHIFLKIYLPSFILLVFQYLTELSNDKIYYVILVIFSNYILLPLITYLVVKPKNIFIHFIVCILYLGSIIFLVNNLIIPYCVKVLSQIKFAELYINLFLKFIQFCLIYFLKGIIIMFKKILTKTAKTKLGKNIASTALGYGETKLSKKLAKEVKESK